MSFSFKIDDMMTAVRLCADILKEQEDLNHLYDKNWNQTELWKYRIAAVREFNEMLDELPSVHKFYGSPKPSDWAMALEEFVDVLHFAASMYMRTAASKTFEDFQHYFDSVGVHRTHKDIQDRLDTINTALDFKGQHISSLFDILATTNATSGEYSFITLFVIGCSMFDVSVDHMFVAYLHKNIKNRSRAKSGAMSKDIDKSKEVGTYQYMHDQQLFADTAEEYNERMRQNERKCINDNAVSV